MRLPPLTADADWSICIRDVADDRVLAEQTPDRLLRTASVGKLFLLCAAAQGLQDGDLGPAEQLGWLPEEWLADSGLWYLMAARELPAPDVCLLVGAVSDNLATNVLLRRIGLPAAAAAARALGCAESALLDRVRSDRGPQHPPTLSVGRADELSLAMARLGRGEPFGEAVTDRVRGWLAANTDLSMVASAYALDPLAHGEADRGVLLCNKTGTISTARIDVGLVGRGGRTLAYAVAANWADGTDPRDRVLADMRAIGDAIAAHLPHVG